MSLAPPTYVRTYGTCPTCGKRLRVSRAQLDGHVLCLLARHGHNPHRAEIESCAGSGRKPVFGSVSPRIAP